MYNSNAPGELVGETGDASTRNEASFKDGGLRLDGERTYSAVVLYEMIST